MVCAYLLTWPLAQPSAREDGPRGAATEGVTNGESAALGMLRAGRPGAGGCSREAHSWLEGGGSPRQMRAHVRGWSKPSGAGWV